MNPQDPINPNPAPPHIHNPLEAMQPGEQVICEIKRHPIGIFGAYIISGLLLIILAVLAFVVAPSVFSDNHKQAMAIGTIVFLILGGITLGFVFIANKVYWENRWIITSDSITQVSQTSLFSKHSSQLSFNNLEDITVEQNGILQQLFKYGVLRAETAGESSKFVFLFCPDPNYYARKVLAAREGFQQRRHVASQPAPSPPQQPLPQTDAYQPTPQPTPQPASPPIFPNEPPQPPIQPPQPPVSPPSY